MLILRQLFDPQSSTYTYLIGDGASREALLVDPVFGQVNRDVALINELGLKLLFTLETHVHADHVTGAWLLKQQLGSRIALSKDSGAAEADVYLTHGDRIDFGDRILQVRATPGHTRGCLSYVLDDQSAVFTGDCLLIRGSGRTDFQQGDPRAMFHSIHNQLFSLPDGCLVYPGHDYRGLTVSSVGEERRFNPRLGGQSSEADFVGYMKCLGLPHPKLIDIAVPANLKCGRPETETSAPFAPAWLRLTYTFAGFWEISPQALEEVIEKVQIVDVREPEEFAGPLGHIPGSKLIPLTEIVNRAGELDRNRPIVTVCRSGARSAQAAILLQREGFATVTNLAGGILHWHDDGHPVDGQ